MNVGASSIRGDGDNLRPHQVPVGVWEGIVGERHPHKVPIHSLTLLGAFWSRPSRSMVNNHRALCVARLPELCVGGYFDYRVYRGPAHGAHMALLYSVRRRVP